MEMLVKLLKDRQYTIASIESLTAGLFSSKIAEVSGASAILKGGLVTYQTICKKEVLHASETIIDVYGVISEEMVVEMVKCGHALFHTDVVVAFSGNAGPDVMENKPAGLVYMALWFHGEIFTYKQIFAGSRNEVRESACEYMVEKIIEILG